MLLMGPGVPAKRGGLLASGLPPVTGNPQTMARLEAIHLNEYAMAVLRAALSLLAG